MYWSYSKKYYILFLIISIILLLMIFTIGLIVGVYKISINDFFLAIFTSNSNYDGIRNILVNLRIPRTIVALLSGIALSVSGLLYQEVFQNRLTSPDLLGVSNGAGFGASLAIVMVLPNIFISIFAFVFGIFSVMLSVIISKLFKNNRETYLLLSGVIVSSIMSSLISFMKYATINEQQLANITFWLMGSFEKSNYQSVFTMLPIISVIILFIFLIRWKVNVISIGRDFSITKGVNYEMYKYLIIACATLLTSITVCFSGTISWVGLIIPHIVRLISGKNPSKNIPFCITLGGSFMIIVDILSRTFTDDEIPLSAITGIFGGIAFIAILISKQRSINVS